MNELRVSNKKLEGKLEDVKKKNVIAFHLEQCEEQISYLHVEYRKVM